MTIKEFYSKKKVTKPMTLVYESSEKFYNGEYHLGNVVIKSVEDLNSIIPTRYQGEVSIGDTKLFKNGERVEEFYNRGFLMGERDSRAYS